MSSSHSTSLALAEYDQPYGGLLDILRGGTGRLLTNIKDTSSKVIQSVARWVEGVGGLGGSSRLLCSVWISHPRGVCTLQT